jgi:chemotaxis protein CheX
MLLNGVRRAAVAGELNVGQNGVETAMTLSLRASLHLVADPLNLDASVEEVFRLMLGVECEREDGPLAQDAESVTAVVGFGGLLSGACVFRCGAKDALQVAGLMTGMEFCEIDDTVKDGIGEICNMLAGAWKGRVPDLAAHCGLSVPAVITGRDYNLHVQAPEFHLQHNFKAGELRFGVSIVCDGVQ